MYVAVALCAAILGGCSQGAARDSLTGPSPVADVVGQPAGNGDRTGPNTTSAAAVRDWAARTGWSATADGLAVEGTDVITALSGSCPDLTITVRGVPVEVTGSTIFADALSCAALAVNLTVKVRALVTYSTTGYSVAATHIGLVEEGGGGGRKASGIGVIGAMTGTCPTLTLVITGTQVQTTATTEYVYGTCETLRPGIHVKVDGELRPGGSAIAERIEVLQNPGRPVSGDGTVSAVTGTCPNITMMVRGIPVVTSATTTFTGGSCDSIREGTLIERRVTTTGRRSPRRPSRYCHGQAAQCRVTALSSASPAHARI